MPPITRSSLAAVINELTRAGWQQSHRADGKTHFYHAQHPRLAAIAQAMTTSKGKAHFVTPR